MLVASTAHLPEVSRGYTSAGAFTRCLVCFVMPVQAVYQMAAHQGMSMAIRTIIMSVVEVSVGDVFGGK